MEGNFKLRSSVVGLSLLGLTACSTAPSRPAECGFEITSNLDKTTITVDDKKTGVLEKSANGVLRVPVSCNAGHEIVASSPEGIKEKSTYLQPPYGSSHRLDFTWTYDEKKDYVPQQDSYTCTEQPSTPSKKGHTASKQMKCVRD
jgi:hypothetical protein